MFCPLAANVGTAAEWAAVFAALIGAIAVFLVSRAANATGRAAKDIQDREASDRRAAVGREAKLLLIYLEPELRQALNSFQLIAQGLEIVEHDSFVANMGARKHFAADLGSVSLRLCRDHFNKWHVLSDTDATDLARTVSGLEVLKSASADVAGIDLSETIPGVEQESFESFRREHISDAYTTLKKGIADLLPMIVRLIDRSVHEKSKLN